VGLTWPSFKFIPPPLPVHHFDCKWKFVRTVAIA